jgi:RNA polymerase sigma factor FliA
MDRDELMLWERWSQERSASCRDALILHYSPWARLVARDVYVRVYLMRDAWRDCVQNALIGLIEAIERFDPNRGVAFRPFARFRVRGAVFDGLRVLQESHVEIAHLAKDHNVLVRERAESLLPQDGEDSVDAFVTMTVGIGLGFLLDNQSIPRSLESHDAYAELEKTQLTARISEEIAQLPARDRSIIVLHYFHQLSFIDIAEQLGVTKGRISQLHKRALERLRLSLRGRSMSIDG